MAAAQTIPTGHGDVIAKELTVGQVREVIDIMSDAKRNMHAIELMFPEMPVAAISLSTGIPVASDDGKDLDDFLPSEISKIIEAVKEVNPDFFGMHGRLVEAGRAALGQSLSTDAAPD